MPDPTGRVSHLPDMHRGVAWKEPVRVATTANVTISTALNAGDTIDGVTLAAGDRVLVKSQSTASQNGIYVAGATPTRAFDMDQDATTSVPASEVMGAFVYVIAGTANGGKIFRSTNTTAPAIGTDSITFSEFSGSSGSVATDTIWEAKGDLAAGTGADAASRVAVGANDTILMADSAQSAGLKWVSSQTPTTQAFSDAASEGSADTYARGDHQHGMPANPVVGGGLALYPLDSVSLDGTFGDDFDEASLNARWSRHNQTSGEETYQLGPRASTLRVIYSTATASRYIYQAAPNNTNETWDCSFSIYQNTTTNQMFGLLMVDSSGNGVAACMYDNASGLFLMNIASHAFSSQLSTTAYALGTHRYGQRVWIRLGKASGVYTASFSVDGEAYSPTVTGTPTSFTPARVGVGRFNGTQSGDTLHIHRFNKTA